ncbi:MAG TPA: carboxypeptidase regulatory-like domain-containing protein, partial [Planctomycetota bacterium]
ALPQDVSPYPDDIAWFDLLVRRSDDFTPVAGAEVVAMIQKSADEVMRRNGKTEADGHVRVPVEPGLMLIGVQVQATLETAPVAVRVDRALEAREVREQVVDAPPAAIVFGRVVDMQGEGIPNARVSCWFRGRWLLENEESEFEADVSSTTNKQGEFRLGGIQEGPFVMDVFADGFASTRRAGGILGIGEIVRGVELRMTTAHAVRGVVRDAAAAGIAEALVTAGRTGRRRRVEEAGIGDLAYYPSRQRLVRTGEDGGFELLSVPDGEPWNLTVEHDRFVPGTERVPADKTFVEVALTRAPSLWGIVVDPNGEPLAGVEFRFRSEVSGRFGSRTDGTFELPGVRPGDELALYAFKGGFAMQLIWPLVFADGERRELRIEMQRGQEISGEILGADGFGAPNARVELRGRPLAGNPNEADFTFERPEELFKVDSQLTDLDGKFRFPNLYPGTFVLRALQSSGEAVELEVAAGTTGLRIPLGGG